MRKQKRMKALTLKKVPETCFSSEIRNRKHETGACAVRCT